MLRATSLAPCPRLYDRCRPTHPSVSVVRAWGTSTAFAARRVPLEEPRVLTSTGARSGQRRETPVSYFTAGDDVILIGVELRRRGARLAGYHNLLAHPECELHIGQRGGSIRGACG